MASIFTSGIIQNPGNISTLHVIITNPHPVDTQNVLFEMYTHATNSTQLYLQQLFELTPLNRAGYFQSFDSIFAHNSNFELRAKVQSSAHSGGEIIITLVGFDANGIESLRIYDNDIDVSSRYGEL